MILEQPKLGKRLKRRRLALKRTGMVVAYNAQVALSTLYDLENGHQAARTDTLARICEALDCGLELVEQNE